MAIGVIAYLVSLSNNPIYRFGMLLNPISDHEEGGFDVVLGENIKQLVRIGWTRSIVVGECDDSFVCVQVDDILSERRSKEKP